MSIDKPGNLYELYFVSKGFSDKVFPFLINNTDTSLRNKGQEIKWIPSFLTSKLCLREFLQIWGNLLGNIKFLFPSSRLWMMSNFTDNRKSTNNGKQHRRLIIFIKKKSFSLFFIPRLEKEDKHQYRKNDYDKRCKDSEFERDFGGSLKLHTAKRAKARVSIYKYLGKILRA